MIGGMIYELMIIVNPSGEIDPILSRVEKSLKDASATSVKINKLGKKILAYPIAKQTEGEYVVVNFEAGGEAVGAISKRLQLEQEAILRYLFIKVKEREKESKSQRVKEPKEIKGLEDDAKESARVVVKTVIGKGAKSSKGTKASKVSKVSQVAKVTKEPKVPEGTRVKEMGKVVVKTVTGKMTKETKESKEPNGLKGSKGTKGKKGKNS